MIAITSIFRTIQGEGILFGLPMVFVRLAGCSIGCSQCDTDYSVKDRLTHEQLHHRISSLTYGGIEWCWITGGEPTDQPEFLEVISIVRDCGLKIAVASAGIKPIPHGTFWKGVDFTSISPHSVSTWSNRRGDQLNLVPGLNGLSLRDPELLDALQQCEANFPYRYVTPMASSDGKIINLDECRQWVECRKGWRLGIQANKVWNLP